MADTTTASNPRPLSGANRDPIEEFKSFLQERGGGGHGFFTFLGWTLYLIFLIDVLQAARGHASPTMTIFSQVAAGSHHVDRSLHAHLFEGLIFLCQIVGLGVALISIWVASPWKWWLRPAIHESAPGVALRTLFLPARAPRSREELKKQVGNALLDVALYGIAVMILAPLVHPIIVGFGAEPWVAALLVFILAWPFSILAAALITSVRPRQGQGDSWTAAAILIGVATGLLLTRHAAPASFLSAMHIGGEEFKGFQGGEALIVAIAVILPCLTALGSMTASDVHPIEIYPGHLPFVQDLPTPKRYAGLCRFKLVRHGGVKLALLLKFKDEREYELRANDGTYDFAMGDWTILNLSCLEDQLGGTQTSDSNKSVHPLAVQVQDVTRQFTAKIHLRFSTYSTDQFSEAFENKPARIPAKVFEKIRDEFASNFKRNLETAIEETYGNAVRVCLAALYKKTAEKFAPKLRQGAVPSLEQILVRLEEDASDIKSQMAADVRAFATACTTVNVKAWKSIVTFEQQTTKRLEQHSKKFRENYEGAFSFDEDLAEIVSDIEKILPKKIKIGVTPREASRHFHLYSPAVGNEPYGIPEVAGVTRKDSEEREGRQFIIDNLFDFRVANVEIEVSETGKDFRQRLRTARQEILKEGEAKGQQVATIMSDYKKQVIEILKLSPPIPAAWKEMQEAFFGEDYLATLVVQPELSTSELDLLQRSQARSLPDRAVADGTAPSVGSNKEVSTAPDQTEPTISPFLKPK